MASCNKRCYFYKQSKTGTWMILPTCLLVLWFVSNAEGFSIHSKRELFNLLAPPVRKSSTCLDMINEGEKAPRCSWPVRVPTVKLDPESEFTWDTLSTDKIFNSKRVVIFGLPGAFTPTCSSQHLPEYEELYESIKKKGVDEVYCLSVNDNFVMNAWKKNLGIQKVKMLPDGNGEFTRGLGLLVDRNNLGFGKRAWRFSMVVNNGTVEKLFVENGLQDNSSEDPFHRSSAASMLQYLDAH